MLFSYRQVFELQIFTINSDLTNHSKVLTYRTLMLKMVGCCIKLLRVRIRTAISHTNLSPSHSYVRFRYFNNTQWKTVLKLVCRNKNLLRRNSFAFSHRCRELERKAINAYIFTLADIFLTMLKTVLSVRLYF